MLLSIILGGLTLISNGQNLIQNGSFENYVGDCDNIQPNGDFRNNVMDWYTSDSILRAGYSPVDLYCGQSNYTGCLPVPNLMGSNENVFAGLHTSYGGQPYNEAIHQTLNTPRIQGNTYIYPQY